MASSIVSGHKQETFESLAPSANILPVRAWRCTIDYLTEKEQDAYALVCKRFAILVICDPSADLEEMEKRKKAIGNSKPISSDLQRSTIGPTSRFFFNHPRSDRTSTQQIHKQIRGEMEDDPTIDQTVRSVCAIESAYPDYIPLYHGGKLEALIYMLFTRVLLSTPYIPEMEKFPCSNPLIKFPSPSGPKTIGEALSGFPPDFNDHMGDVRKELLSCNPFLFANFTDTGESTWNFYLLNRNKFPYRVSSFFQELCKQYQIKPHQKYLNRLEILHEELYQLAITFVEQIPREQKLWNGIPVPPSICKGVLLQILVKPPVLDKIGYASLAFGEIDKDDEPLSKRCLALREDPDSEPFMQIRLLAQSIFINSYGIKVFVYCCGGFFNEEGLPDNKPNHMTEMGWAIQKKCLLRKDEIFKEARDIFTKMILLSPKKQKKTVNILPSITPKAISFNYFMLQRKALMTLPPGFSLRPHYNEKNLLAKVVQTDSDGQETTYLLSPPKTVSVTKEMFDKLASEHSPYSSRRVLNDKLGNPAEILEFNQYDQDTLYIRKENQPFKFDKLASEHPPYSSRLVLNDQLGKSTEILELNQDDQDILYIRKENQISKIITILCLVQLFLIISNTFQRHLFCQQPDC
jgi:hypothetical protein